MQAGDRAGTEFAVEAPTLVQAVASFTGGQVAQTLFSFDSPMARTGYVEITGTEATMLVPDPNLFGGSVRLTRPVTLATVQSETEWIDVPVPDETYGRGAGALDLARCIRGGGEPIASGELGYHVLDVMASIASISPRIGPIPRASMWSVSMNEPKRSPIFWASDPLGGSASAHSVMMSRTFSSARSRST